MTTPSGQVIDFITDPCAREVAIGRQSAITVGYKPYVFSAHELSWKTPALQDLVVYELMISEFRYDIDRTIHQLRYLADLGITCIELMPLGNVLDTIDWGYDPIGYFGVAERFGRRADLQRLVDAAHQAGLAVIVDSVYGHTGAAFAYTWLYSQLPDLPNPFNGPGGAYGPTTDFASRLTQDYYYSVNRFWLDTFHIDGFRYDDVPEYWDGPTGTGYANLVFSTYQYVTSQAPTTDHFQRFFAGDGSVRLIQIAEYLPDPPTILAQSYSTGTWQDGTLAAAAACAAGSPGSIAALGLQLGLDGYPAAVTANGVTLPKSALQYLENHDHQRFLCNFGTVPIDQDPANALLQAGDRAGAWFKVQPYLIALLTCKGVPLLAEGQEFCEDYWIPDQGYGRVMVYRPLHWEYFGDPIGQTMVGQVRRLLLLRRTRAEFTSGDYYFYNDDQTFNARGLLAFSRRTATACSLVVVNLTGQDQSTLFAMPVGGAYTEQLSGGAGFNAASAGAQVVLTVPSHFGRIWSSP